LSKLHDPRRFGASDGVADSCTNSCNIHLDQFEQLHIVSVSLFCILSSAHIMQCLAIYLRSLPKSCSYRLVWKKGHIYVDKTLAFAPTEPSTARSMWAPIPTGLITCSAPILRTHGNVMTTAQLSVLLGLPRSRLLILIQMFVGRENV